MKKKAKKVLAKSTKRRQQTRAVAVKRGQSELHQRRDKNKKINQQQLREKIAAGNHHHHIVDVLTELDKLYKEVGKKKVMTREDQAKYMTRLGILKTKMDGQFRLLSKYLPDLRSIEFKEGEDGNPFATAAKAWAKALSK